MMRVGDRVIVSLAGKRSNAVFEGTIKRVNPTFLTIEAPEGTLDLYRRYITRVEPLWLAPTRGTAWG